MYIIPVLTGGWVMGERAIEEGYRWPEMGQLALSKGLARMGIMHALNIATYNVCV